MRLPCVNADGTSTITLTPTVPLSTDMYAIGVSQFLSDLTGDPLLDAQGQPGTYFSSFLLRVPSDNSTPTVSSITTLNGSAPIDGSAIPQPDTIAIAFSKAMSLTSINGTSVHLMAKQSDGSSAIVPAAVAYSPSTLAAYLTPTAVLSPGTLYTVTVDATVGDDHNFPDAGNLLAAPVSANFTVLSGPLGPSSGPLTLARDAQGGYQTLPLPGVPWSLPTGYAALRFSERVSRDSLGRFSIMLVPRSGGLNTAAFDPADVPLNAKLAINPNTNQVIVVPTVPLGSDMYVFSIGGTAADNSNRATAANPDGSANLSDPLTDGGGLPVYPPPFLLQASSSSRAASTAAAPSGSGVVTASVPRTGTVVQSLARIPLAQGGVRKARSISSGAGAARDRLFANSLEWVGVRSRRGRAR